VTQAHLHYAQRGVNGGIMVFLCSNLGNGPAGTQPCPPTNGTISGTITSANVLGVSGQSLAANDMPSLLRGIRGNVVYVNVHTDQLPGGSIRGQLLFTPRRPGVGGGPPPDPNATFTRVQNEVFTSTCARIGCHDTIGQQSRMILSSGRAYDQIVNVPSVEMPDLARVKPNDPANSYLYRKITGAGITGDRMPQGLPPLSDAQISLIRDWIRRGAPND
jgi:CHRD domain-containing protein